ncbi:uncharacterized protein ARMOST_07700 [Armillaria ostoyae]|uniref:Uncharacterized protein n=1 Tax=Armillaria ostoyae TaxID=47428 RepID=A0A284R6L3_ARMOS|nr:uncharacterized protein ARMOST_07700 [Armillaria ostoyae]
MSSANEYCCSVTPKPYEPTPLPSELTFKEYEVFVSEQASVEERYSEAMGAHEEWKVERAKEAQLEKLKVDKEAQVEKLKVLQKKEEERKAAEEKKKEEERHAAILRVKQEAKAKQKKLAALKAEKEAADAMAEKKKKDDLKKEEKRLRKEQKKVEKAVKATDTTGSKKGKAAAKAVESALVNEEKGTDVDTEGELLEGAKEKALKKLKEVRDGKRKATVPVGPKRKRATKSTSVVEESDGESRPGPSKRMKAEVLRPAEGEEEFNGSKRCMRCCQDVAHCFACPASEKSIRRQTCLRCKAKKATCSVNKGTSSVLAVSSEVISEQLQKLVHTVETLSNKVDVLMGQAVSLMWTIWLMISSIVRGVEGFGKCELQGSPEGYGVWLDEDMAQLRVKGPVEPEKLNADNPYEVANHEFWYGLGGPEKMAEMKLKHDLFQATRNEFYKLEGHRSEWQFWKAYLQKHNCDDFLVEDSDPGEKVLDGKVRKLWKPYGKDLGIPVLDSLFILDGDSTGATMSEEEDEESDEDEKGLEFAKDDKDAPVGGAEDVEMREVTGVVDA